MVYPRLALRARARARCRFNFGNREFTVAHIAIIVAVVFWASVFIASKPAVEVMPVSEVALLRFGIGAVLLWIPMLLLRQLVAFRWIGAWALVIGAVDGLSVVIIYAGLQITSALNATVIYALFPLVLSLFGRAFLGEAITRAVSVGSVLALGGTVLLVSDDDPGESFYLGDLMVIAGFLMNCGTQTALRYLNRGHDRVMGVAAYQLLGMALIAAVFLFGVPSERAAMIWSGVPLEVWILVIYLAVSLGALGFYLYNYALRHLPVARVGLYFVLMAPLGAPMAALYLGEPVTPIDILSIALVCFGVALPYLGHLPLVRPLFAAKPSD